MLGDNGVAEHTPSEGQGHGNGGAWATVTYFRGSVQMRNCRNEGHIQRDDEESSCMMSTAHVMVTLWVTESNVESVRPTSTTNIVKTSGAESTALIKMPPSSK